MYIRKSKRKHGGKVYISHSLVESYRTKIGHANAPSVLWEISEPVHARIGSRGQPKRLAPECVTLIRAMAKDNVLWGAERIRGELLKLGR